MLQAIPTVCMRVLLCMHLKLLMAFDMGLVQLCEDANLQYASVL